MKKLFALLLLLPIMSSAQIKSINLLDQQIGDVHLLYNQRIDFDKGDTLYIVYMGFKNAKYSSLTDIRSIGLINSESLDDFIKDLSSAKKQMETGEKVSMSWDRKLYQIELLEFTKECSLGDKDGRGYTWLSIKQVNKLLSALKRITIGSTQILPE